MEEILSGEKRIKDDAFVRNYVDREGGEREKGAWEGRGGGGETVSHETATTERLRRAFKSSRCYLPCFVPFVVLCTLAALRMRHRFPPSFLKRVA